MSILIRKAIISVHFESFDEGPSYDTKIYCRQSKVRQNGRFGRIKSFSDRSFRRLKIVMKTKKIPTSAAIFEEAVLPNVSKSTRNEILKCLRKVGKAKKQPPLMGATNASKQTPTSGIYAG